MEIIFVCGCPRSGTSAITTLLNSHQSIAVGMERFKNYATRDKIAQLKPSLFERKRFFDFRPDDTNILPTPGKPGIEKLYKRMDEKLLSKQRTFYIGDKNPFLYYYYPVLERNFTSVKVIFMIRDIYRVALSFQHRYDNPDDAWPLDYRDAVKHWNASLERTEDAQLRGNLNIMIAPYHRIFSGEETAIERIASFLCVDKTESIIDKHKELTDNWQARNSEQFIPEMISDYVKKNADIERYNRVISNYDSRH